MIEYVSNCCSAPMPDWEECDLCPQCLEHCESVDMDEDEDVCTGCHGEASRDGKNCNKCKGSGTSRPALGRW